MTSTDVVITAAREDADTAMRLEGALAAAGMTCTVDAGDGAVSPTLNALESCRGMVLVLSAAANGAAHVVRALERASGRGVPIVTFAVAAVAPSPSIAYFTGTAAPIPGWSGIDPAEATAAFVAACRNALQSSSGPHRRPASRPAFSRATYADPRPLLAVLTTILVISCLANVYALVQDARIVMSEARRAVGEPVVPVDPVSSPFVAPAAVLWAVIIGSIILFRRARRNLLARFVQTVTIGAGEIVWRPLVPFANVLWLPRLATDLRQAGLVASGVLATRWRLATIWRLGLGLAYFLVLIRDFVTRVSPGNPAIVPLLGMALEATCLGLAVVAYRAWYSIASVVAQQPTGAPAPRSARPVPEPATMTARVLILHQPEDEPLARTMALQLDRLGSRCWSYSGESRTPAFEGFQAILVIVSQASHTSDSIVSLVQSALAARAHVVPVVLDQPPAGSPLGHYVRALHWLDAANLFVPGHEAALASAIGSSPAASSPSSIDERVFTPVAGARLQVPGYRPTAVLRRAAWASACLQIVVSAALFAVALMIARDAEGAGDPSGNLSILFLGVSLPAWAFFLAWLARTHNNAAALFVSGLDPRRQLLLRVGIPMVSMVAGGRALARTFAAILGGANEDVQRRATQLALAWTLAGVVFTVCALLGWYLIAYHRLVAVAMVLSMLQALATMSRGLVRVKTINAVEAHFKTRARVRGRPLPSNDGGALRGA